jgi:hypothetical protein
MANNKVFSLKPCTTSAGESGLPMLQPCTQAEKAFTVEEAALKRKSPMIGLKVSATKKKGDDDCAVATDEEAPAAEKEVLDHNTNVTEAADKMMDEEEEEDDYDDEDDEDEDEDDFDTVYAECKKQHEEHLQQLIASLPFVLKFKDYSIDSDGEENEPVEWK